MTIFYTIVSRCCKNIQNSITLYSHARELAVRCTVCVSTWAQAVTSDSEFHSHDTMLIEMAQNEAEGAQAVVLASFTEDVHNVTWSVVNLTHNESGQLLNASADITVAPYGFVHQGRKSGEVQTSRR